MANLTDKKNGPYDFANILNDEYIKFNCTDCKKHKIIYTKTRGSDWCSSKEYTGDSSREIIREFLREHTFCVN